MAPRLYAGDKVLVDPRPEAVPLDSLVLANIDGSITPRWFLSDGERTIFEALGDGVPRVPALRHQVLGLIVAILERKLVPDKRKRR
jgi:SOS-response transcriptional repressor LexA